MATTRTRATAPKVSNWTADQSINNSGFVSAWQTPSGSKKPTAFTKAVFQLNTEKLYMQVVIVNEDATEDVKLDVDLEEIAKDFKLTKAQMGHLTFAIMEYGSPTLWIYQPSDPLLINSGDHVEIRFKSKSGTKKAVRGMSEWGEL